MRIEEKIREIMLSEELPDSEKLDRLHALIPTNVFKIDKLHKGRLRSSGSRTKDLRSPMQFNRSGDGVVSADPLVFSPSSPLGIGSNQRNLFVIDWPWKEYLDGI
jgi:hypothetical protein